MKLISQIDRWRTLAKLFTRPVMATIARTGSAEVAFRQLRKSGIPVEAETESAGDIFDKLFEELRSFYRCEYVYKAAITDRIIFGRHSPRTASMQLELPVGRSIVDAAIFNGTSTAYEIKTELDSQKRLRSQSQDYLKVFDRVYVVTHPSLATRYADSLDDRIGILILSESNRLSEVRSAVSNAHQIDPALIFRVLRRDEYVDAVVRYFGPQPELPNGSIFVHHERLFATLSAELAHDAFVKALVRRTNDADTVTYVSALPKSLRALGYATPLSMVQRSRLLQAVG